MNIFRIFFVSVVLIPVLVVVATSDESGIRIRKPRSIVISEDGTRTARRHNPVNISDKNCPALGCTGNLTTSEHNGKGSLASSILSSGKEKRFDSSSSNSTFHHDRPLKLEIKSIKNSTRSDIDNYIVASDIDEIGTGRGIIKYAIILSWTFYWTWKIIITIILYYTFTYCWNWVRKSYGIGDDYIEYYVKLGKDQKHPFHNYGGGWNPTFGVSLKSKVEEVHPPGWKGSIDGWKKRLKGWTHHQKYAYIEHEPVHHASSYHDHHHHHQQAGWPPAYHAGWQDYGWPAWPAPPPKKGWKSESEEEEDNLRHKFDMRKGWKIAKKYTKKYGKKAHKYGLRPSKYSYMFNEDGNIILGGKNEGYAWRRRSDLALDVDDPSKVHTIAKKVIELPKTDKGETST